MMKYAGIDAGRAPGVWIGRSAEAGIWWHSVSRYRMLWRNHDCLFIAVGRVRMRIMKPRWAVG